MKIAQIAPLIESVPPKYYGGTERMIYALTEELVRMGHEVTLFASGDSKTNARLIPVTQTALRERKTTNLYGPNPFTIRNIGLAYQNQSDFDIIHDHNGLISLPTANISQTPVVATIHSAISPQLREAYQALSKPYFVTISNAQRVPAPDLHYIGTVYNGLYLDDYPVSATHDSYLLFVGRIAMEKGVHHAIEVAEELDLPLKIVAKLEDLEMNYFQTYIKPKLSHKIQWLGEVTETERNKLMSHALCLLHPVTWREPFGLVLIEAMACGCPVVAFDKGSIPEIIQHGKTGFVASDIDEMIEGVEKIDQIDREYCATYAKETFSAKRMAKGYEEVYKKVLTQEYGNVLSFEKNFKRFITLPDLFNKN